MSNTTIEKLFNVIFLALVMLGGYSIAKDVHSWITAPSKEERLLALAEENERYARSMERCYAKGNRYYYLLGYGKGNALLSNGMYRDEMVFTMCHETVEAFDQLVKNRQFGFPNYVHSK